MPRVNDGLQYHERWERDADAPLAVYVPTSRSWLFRHLAPKSALVGRPWPEAAGNRTEVCFEGSGATYAERVLLAAGRLVAEYPTVARAVVRSDELVRVGTYVPRTRQLDVTDPGALEAWLGAQTKGR